MGDDKDDADGVGDGDDDDVDDGVGGDDDHDADGLMPGLLYFPRKLQDFEIDIRG